VSDRQEPASLHNSCRIRVQRVQYLARLTVCGERCYCERFCMPLVDASIRLLPQSGSASRWLTPASACYCKEFCLAQMKSRPQPFGSWTASVNCSDWPVTTGVQHPEKEEHFAVRQLNRNPNELVLVQRSGRSHLTVIRTHIFLNHLLSSVAAIIK